MLQQLSSIFLIIAIIILDMVHYEDKLSMAAEVKAPVSANNYIYKCCTLHTAHCSEEYFMLYTAECILHTTNCKLYAAQCEGTVQHNEMHL